ncbi:MAG: glycoside hydrolase domain-containing protein [Ginsengibacter sp.]
MKKIALLLPIYIFFSVVTFAQVQPGEIDISKVPAATAHYEQEYTFDTIKNSTAWFNQKPGLHVSWGSTDKLYFRREVPGLIKETNSIEETLWKGDRLNAMILVWSPDMLNQVRFRLNNLINANGKVLSEKNIRLYLVRYVVSNYPYGAKDVTCGASPYKSLYLMPDRFDPIAPVAIGGLDRFDLPGKTVRPVWLSLDIPADTQPGIYNGTIEIYSEKFTSMLNYKIRVQNQTLPKPHEWKHRLDLWQNPVIVARYDNLKPWSEEHLLLLKKHLKLYADAGGKYITTYAVHSPWSDNSYRAEEAMIEWTKLKNRSWKFNYSIFDKYVELAMSAGIDKAITIYTPVPNGYRVRYLDEKSGNYMYEYWSPGSKEFTAFWNIFLTDLKKHLEQKGWFEKTYIGINENPLDETLAAIKVIKTHSKKWKITYAGDWHKELDDLLDDYCFLYGKESNVDVVKRRIKRGLTTTYYVCCNPPVPNNFVFSPPIEGRWMGWYSSAHGYDGFLRWAYDAWPADPLRDARHELWPAGDCYLVYPGGSSGIRFEKLREGIVDYEKIRIIKELASKSIDKDVKNLMLEFEHHLQSFVAEHDFETGKITDDVNRGKELLIRLSDRLAR